jgi:hypothetical protein
MLMIQEVRLQRSKELVHPLSAPAKLPRSVAIPAKACANTFDRDCTTRPYSLQELEVPFRQREGFRELSEPVEAQTPWCHCTMAAGDRSVQ